MRITNLEGISDGKVYDIRDMVKADAGGCDGCSACCHGVGDLVNLTPFDIYEMTRGMNLSFDGLLEDKLVLLERKKLLVPHLKMIGETDKCAFLNDKNRCSIHDYRPGICRLFPLGRIYEDDDIKYFLQVDACTKKNLGKVKVKKWIGIDNYKDNKAHVLLWHKFVKALQFRLKFMNDEEDVRAVNDYVIENLYRLEVEEGQNFYPAFQERLEKAKDKLSLL